MDKDLEQKPQFPFFGFQHLLAGISEPRPVENRMWISENLIEMYFLNSLIRYCNYGWKSIVLKRLGASQSHLQISMLELVFLNQGFVDLTGKEISDPKINITNRSGIEFYAQRGPQNSNNFKCQDRGRELTRSKENPRFKCIFFTFRALKTYLFCTHTC